MSVIITNLTSIVSYLCSMVGTVVQTVVAQGNELLFFAVGLSLCGIAVHWFKMIFRA